MANPYDQFSTDQKQSNPYSGMEVKNNPYDQFSKASGGDTNPYEAAISNNDFHKSQDNKHGTADSFLSGGLQGFAEYGSSINKGLQKVTDAIVPDEYNTGFFKDNQKYWEQLKTKEKIKTKDHEWASLGGEILLDPLNLTPTGIASKGSKANRIIKSVVGGAAVGASTSAFKNYGDTTKTDEQKYGEMAIGGGIVGVLNGVIAAFTKGKVTNAIKKVEDIDSSDEAKRAIMAIADDPNLAKHYGISGDHLEEIKKIRSTYHDVDPKFKREETGRKPEQVPVNRDEVSNLPVPYDPAARLESIASHPRFDELIGMRENVAAKNIQYDNVLNAKRHIIPGSGKDETIVTPADYSKNYDADFVTTKQDIANLKKGNIDEKLMDKLTQDLHRLDNDPAWSKSNTDTSKSPWMDQRYDENGVPISKDNPAKDNGIGGYGYDKDGAPIGENGMAIFANAGTNTLGGALGGGTVGGMDAAYEDIVDGKDLTMKDYLARIGIGAAVGAGLGYKYGGKAEGTGLFAGARAKGYDAAPVKHDGKYDDMSRFEIDDSKMSLKPDAISTLEGKGEMKIADVIDHKELYDNYPDAANIKIKVDDSLQPGSGWFKDGVLGIPKGTTDKELLDTAVHEIQHWIQFKEGFATGGSQKAMMQNVESSIYKLEKQGDLSPADAIRYKDELEYLKGNKSEEAFNRYQRLAGEIEAREVEARRGLTKGEREAINPYENAVTAYGRKNSEETAAMRDFVDLADYMDGKIPIEETNFFKVNGGDASSFIEHMGSLERSMPQLADKSPEELRVVLSKIDDESGLREATKNAMLEGRLKNTGSAGIDKADAIINFNRSKMEKNLDHLKDVVGEDRVKEWKDASSSLWNLFRDSLSSEYHNAREKVTAKSSGDSVMIERVHKVLTDLSEKDRLDMHDYITGEGSALSSDLKPFADLIKNDIRSLGEQAVNLNVLSKESFDEWSGYYIRRNYEKHFFRDIKNLVGRGFTVEDIHKRGKVDVVGKDEADKIVQNLWTNTPDNPLNIPLRDGGVRVVDLGNGKFEIRRDWTRAEREAMGEIRDASITIPDTLMRMKRMVDNANFLKEVSDMDSVVLKDFRERVFDLDGNPIDGKAKYNSEELKAMGFVEVSNHPRFGALAGKAIRKDVYDDIVAMNDDLFGTLHGADGALARVWKGYLSLWKKSKTVWNVPSHINNFASNLFIMHLSGMKSHEIISALGKAGKMMYHEGKYEELIAKGLRGENTLEDMAELSTLGKDLRYLVEAKEGGLLGRSQLNDITDGRQNSVAKSLLGALDKKAQELYHNGDAINRIAMYTHLRDKMGLGIDEAKSMVLKVMPDYSKPMPKGYRVLRDTGVSPFISWTYYTMPAIWKLMKTKEGATQMAKAVGLVSAMEYMLSDGQVTPLDNLPFYDGNKPDEFKGRRFAIGRDGSKIDTLKIDRWIPYLELQNPPNFVLSQISGPTVKAITNLATAGSENGMVDTYTGKAVTMKKDASQRAYDTAKYLTESYVPLPGTAYSAYDYVESLVRDQKKRKKNSVVEPRTQEQSILKILGLNTMTYDKDNLKREQRKK